MLYCYYVSHHIWFSLLLISIIVLVAAAAAAADGDEIEKGRSRVSALPLFALSESSSTFQKAEPELELHHPDGGSSFSNNSIAKHAVFRRLQQKKRSGFVARDSPLLVYGATRVLKTNQPVPFASTFKDIGEADWIVFTQPFDLSIKAFSNGVVDGKNIVLSSHALCAATQFESLVSWMVWRTGTYESGEKNTLVTHFEAGKITVPKPTSGQETTFIVKFKNKYTKSPYFFAQVQTSTYLPNAIGVLTATVEQVVATLRFVGSPTDKDLTVGWIATDNDTLKITESQSITIVEAMTTGTGQITLPSGDECGVPVSIFGYPRLDVFAGAWINPIGTPYYAAFSASSCTSDNKVLINAYANKSVQRLSLSTSNYCRAFAVDSFTLKDTNEPQPEKPVINVEVTKAPPNTLIWIFVGSGAILILGVIVVYFLCQPKSRFGPSAAAAAGAGGINQHMPQWQ